MPANLSDVQIALRDAAFVVAEQFGVGGTRWTVTRSSGDGGSGPISTNTHTITAYVKRNSPSRLAVALAGERTVSDSWSLVAKDGTNVQAGDTIQSAADATLRFTVQPCGYTPGYINAPLERQR